MPTAAETRRSRAGAGHALRTGSRSSPAIPARRARRRCWCARDRRIRTCTAPDRTHGPPLAFPSCASPTPASPNLRVGNPQQPGGAPANMAGSVRFDAIAGTPGPPDDGEDILIKASITDVRCTVRNLNIYIRPPAGHRTANRRTTTSASCTRQSTPGRQTGSMRSRPAAAPTRGRSRTSHGTSCRAAPRRRPASGARAGRRQASTPWSRARSRMGSDPSGQFGQVRVYDSVPTAALGRPTARSYSPCRECSSPNGTWAATG